MIFQVKQLNGIPWILPNGIISGKSLSFSITSVAGTNSVLQGITTGNFQLAWNGTIAQVSTIAGFNLFDQANRKPLRDSLDAFIIALDQLEATANLVPGGARLITQITAQYLPLPLSEVPLYFFNLTNPLLYTFLQATQTYIDLIPGMRLAVCGANLYQENLDTGAVPAYGGSGNSYLYISTIPGKNLLSYESFLDNMGIHVPLGAGSKIRVASGSVDFMSGTELQPYNRLFYPTGPGNSFTAINLPDNNPANNASIVRAESYQNMLQYTNSFPFCCQAAGGRCSLFFGRTQLIPQINIRVNSEQVFVPVGTTLRHVVEKSYTSVARPKNLQFLRYINQYGINIIFENATIGFDMFLVPGDDISW
ncbi:MAG: hypothetical protein V4450_00050 [Bacteroidota bacterium]